MVQILNIKEDDPNRDKKRSFVEGVTYFDGLINSMQRDIEEHLLLFFSIIIGGLLGALLTSNLWMPSLLAFGILIFLSLIIFLKEKKDKERLIEERSKLVLRAKKEVKIDLREWIGKKFI